MHRIVTATILALCSLAVAKPAHAEQLLRMNHSTALQVSPSGGWKLADLAGTMSSLHDRSYSNGKRLFERANCITCHRQDNVGNEFGPDLTRLDLQFQPIDILRDILDPSRRIADAKYDVWVYETAAGHLVAGMVFQETDQFVKIMEKPLAVAPPIVLLKSEIESRAMSLTSMMPQGLVDKLTADEIADLVAYIAARGDPTDPVIHSPGRDSNSANQNRVPIEQILAKRNSHYANHSGIGASRRHRPRCR